MLSKYTTVSCIVFKQFVVELSKIILVCFPIVDSAAGTSMDWAKVKVGVPYSYTYELRPGAGNSQASFIIPDTNIVPSGEEVWASLVSIAREVPL